MVSDKTDHHPMGATTQGLLLSYAMAAKAAKTGRQLFVKLQKKHQRLLEQVLMALKEFEPPPI